MAGKSRDLTRTLTSAGYAVAYMNGSSRRGGDNLRTWNAAHCCAYAQRKKINETAYADAAIEALDRRLGIDRSRIFLAGHSNGAMLSYRLAGAMKVTPRGIAPISGAIFADQPDVPDRTSVFMYHAVDDEVLSYSGNPDDKAERWRTEPHLGFLKAEAKLAELKSCGPGAATPAPEGLSVTTRQCAGGSVLIASTATSGGHEWPARPQSEYRIEDALLAFFDSQK
jgi:polyhydroxybutyrate depolymerase